LKRNRRAPGDPEAAFVGKLADRLRFPGELGAHRVEFMRPAGGGQILQDFGTVGQVHEGSPGLVLKITVAELDQPRILPSPLPEQRLASPMLPLARRRVAVVGRENQRGPGRAEPAQPPQGPPPQPPPGDLHQPVEHEGSAAEKLRESPGGSLQPGGIRLDKGDGPCAAYGGEAAGLVEQLPGKIKSGQIPIAEIPEAQRHATGAATGLDQSDVSIREKALDQDPFRRPQAQPMRRPGVMEDGSNIVEVGSNRLGGQFHDAA